MPFTTLFRASCSSGPVRSACSRHVQPKIRSCTSSPFLRLSFSSVSRASRSASAFLFASSALCFSRSAARLSSVCRSARRAASKASISRFRASCASRAWTRARCSARASCRRLSETSSSSVRTHKGRSLRSVNHSGASRTRVIDLCATHCAGKPLANSSTDMFRTKAQVFCISSLYTDGGILQTLVANSRHRRSVYTIEVIQSLNASQPESSGDTGSRTLRVPRQTNPFTIDSMAMRCQNMQAESRVVVDTRFFLFFSMKQSARRSLHGVQISKKLWNVFSASSTASLSIVSPILVVPNAPRKILSLVLSSIISSMRADASSEVRPFAGAGVRRVGRLSRLVLPKRMKLNISGWHNCNSLKHMTLRVSVIGTDDSCPSRRCIASPMEGPLGWWQTASSLGAKMPRTSFARSKSLVHIDVAVALSRSSLRSE